MAIFFASFSTACCASNSRRPNCHCHCKMGPQVLGNFWACLGVQDTLSSSLCYCIRLPTVLSLVSPCSNWSMQPSILAVCRSETTPHFWWTATASERRSARRVGCCHRQRRKLPGSHSHRRQQLQQLLRPLWQTHNPSQQRVQQQAFRRSRQRTSVSDGQASVQRCSMGRRAERTATWPQCLQCEWWVPVSWPDFRCYLSSQLLREGQAVLQ